MLDTIQAPTFDNSHPGQVKSSFIVTHFILLFLLTFSEIIWGNPLIETHNDKSPQSPSHIHYQNLLKAYQYYQRLAPSVAHAALPSGATLQPLSTDVRIKAISRRLTVLGDLKNARALTDFYSPELVSAVEQFQKRHGLTVDGLIGKKTIAALNISIAERLKQISINLQRWQSLSLNLSGRYLIVNIPAFDLTAVENQTIKLHMAVVVGTEENKTAIFSDEIEYIQFHPYWNIPTSIAYKEMLPALQQNPNHLSAQHIRVFSSWNEDATEIDPTQIDWAEIGKDIKQFKLRQDPGPWNALGKVKFVLPNQYGIYLHDSPAQHLFACTVRSFSHGCVRLGDPLVLAAFALADKNSWNETRIKAVIESEKSTIVRLTKPLAVHFTYQTAWVDQHGLLHFSKDIYGWDK